MSQIISLDTVREIADSASDTPERAAARISEIARLGLVEAGVFQTLIRYDGVARDGDRMSVVFDAVKCSWMALTARGEGDTTRTTFAFLGFGRDGGAMVMSEAELNSPTKKF